LLIFKKKKKKKTLVRSQGDSGLDQKALTA